MSDWKPVALKGPGPKYLALIGALELGISEGKLVAGDQLPPQRELAEMFDVTIATVTRAIAEASRRGLIVARPGSGTFVKNCDTPLSEFENGVVDFNINTLPTELVSDILNAALRTLTQKRQIAEMFGYTSYRTRHDLRAHSADWLKRFGLDANPEQILITHGVHQGLMAALGALAKPGDSAICEPLTYTGIKRIADYRGLNLVPAEFDEDGLVPESVAKELHRTGAKVVIITTVTQNPTTATLPSARRQELAQVCRQADAVIIEDGVNIPLANDGNRPVADYAPERTIHLTGLSKCVAPGLRVGYAIVPERLLPSFTDALISTHWIAPPVLYTELADILLSSDMIVECLVRHREEAKWRMELACRTLSGVRLVTHPVYHAWVDAIGWQADQMSAQALRSGVRISPASHFAIKSAMPPPAFRISLGGCGSREALDTGLTLLSRVMQAKPITLSTVV